jgi:deoxyribodipyrimidine photo-lyase
MPNEETHWRDDPRVRVLVDGEPNPSGTCIVYWMQRSQRGTSNAALNLAITLGNARGLPVIGMFGLTANYPGAQRRHYRFLVDALPEIRDEMAERGVPLVVRIGQPDEVVTRFVADTNPAALIGDENPVRVGKAWRDAVAKQIMIPFLCVDGDVVVPISHFSSEEYAARTIRPKIHRLWDRYLKATPNPRANHSWREVDLPRGERIDPDRLMEKLRVGGVDEVADYRGGPTEAKRRLQRFIRDRLEHYATGRNEPTPCVTSELSAHLHFGHIDPVTIALAAIEADPPKASLDAFLEELIVRRELAINFVARNPRYDELAGCPAWARQTLAKHGSDPRPYTYTQRQLEAAETHDPLWNAAQKEMVLTGRMHNYLRMYWAKKILEWSPDAESAFDIALELNDNYEMDGRDPNGYSGVAWAIGGKHDRPWPERPIFGTVRFMSYESTRKKFDSAAYIRRIDALES